MSEKDLDWHVALVDDRLRIVHAEPGFLRMLGISEFNAQHRRVLDLLHPDGTQNVRAALVALGSGALREVAERVTLTRPDGQVSSVAMTALALAEPTRILLAIAEPAGVDPLPSPAGQFQLSPVDAMILEDLVSGVPVSETAKRVRLSRQGVEYHVMAMVRQFDAVNRTALVAKAHAAGVFVAGVHPPRVDPRFLESCVRVAGS